MKSFTLRAFLLFLLQASFTLAETTITVIEMTSVAQKIITQTYRTMEVFLCAAAIYLALNFAVARLVGLLEWRLTRHVRRAPVLAPVLHE